MQVNREWWDGTTTTYDEDGAERVTILSDKLWTKIQANPEKYIGKEWDKSICPWKIGYGSDLFKSMWCLPYANLENQFTFTSSPFYKERKKGYTFYLSCNGTTNSGQRPGNKSNSVATSPVWLGTLSRGDIDLNDTVTANWLSLKAGDINPVINFDYSNIFVVPMFYNSANVGFYITSNTETTWNANDVYGLGFMFYQKKTDGTASTSTAIDIISLNNKIDKPSWTVTNSWNEDTMFDNTLALQKYLSWDGGYEISSYTAIGTHLQTGDTYIDGANYPGNGYNYDNPKLATDDAAGSVYYIPNKQMSISAPTTDSDIWEDEFTPVYLGAEYNFGIHRHLKSSVTYSQFIEYVKKQLAYLGFRFCVFAEDVNKNINSEYFFIPEIDSKGVTTGNYVAANAPEAENYINYTWTDDVYESTPYDGTDDDDDEGDPNEYDENNETELNALAAQAKNYFFNTYCLSPTQLRQLSEYMYTEMPTNQSTEDFLTNNPIDVIINLQMFPFTIAAGVTPDILMLGKIKPRYWDATASEWKDILVYNVPTQVIILDCGSCTYYPEYGVHDFRNYEPYCTAELELPYCGNIKIPTSVYLNHTIKVKYIVDLITGACLALVYRDDLAYLAVTGQIGTQFPVSAVQSADLQASIMRKQTQYGESLINVARSTIGGALSVQGAANAAPAPGASTALGAYTGLLSAFNQLEQAEFNVEHIQVPFTMHGSSSPMTSFANEQYPRLILKRPVMLPDYNAENYGHIVGFACNITAPLSAFSGLTVCSTANLDGVAATEAEKQLLRRALLDGIIL